MKVAIIGSTGFVGTYVTRALIAAGHTPRLLVRPGSEDKVACAQACETVSGEVGERASLDRCLAGCDAVIYLIGILREYPSRGVTFEVLQYQGVVDTIAAAEAAGVRKIIYMSANGVEACTTPYQATKLQAEQAVKDSALAWTIVRPSVIFGDPQGRMEFCTQLKQELIDLPLPAPLFYEGLLPRQAGGFKLAPVGVEDVAAVFAKALDEPHTDAQTYSLCGPERLSWKEIIQTIAAASGKTKMMTPAPAAAVKAVAGLFDRFSWFPLSRDQLTMLMQGNVCDGNDSFARLDMIPTRFNSESLGYLRH